MVSSEEHQAFLNLSETVTRRHGAEVIEIVLRGDKMRRVVELYVDSEAGVSLGLCQEISKSLIQEIDTTALAPGTYRLEVSSPGIDRPLKFPWQYRKHSGRKVEVSWNEETGKQSGTGKLLSVDNDGIVFQPDKGAEERHIAFGSIIETRIKTPW